MVCPNCYAKVEPDDEFCGECGKRLKAAGPSSMPEAVSNASAGEIQSMPETPVYSGEIPANPGAPVFSGEIPSIPNGSQPMGQVPAPAQPEFSQPEYLQPGLDAPRKKSRLWLIILGIVLMCAVSVVCLLVLAAEYL